MTQQHQSPLLADPKQLLLDMARVHNLADLLQLLVNRFGESPRVALARIWLIMPGDICSSCPMRPECPNQERCLHLVASAGHSIKDKNDEWSQVTGSFRRFPLGIRKVGKIAATGDALEVPSIANAHDWIARPEWIQSEGVCGFGGQPLVHHGKVLGVMAVFARCTIGTECMAWLRTIANHAAAAIATARAFDEIESLKKQLELENEYLREEVTRTGAFGELIGQSPALETVTRQIDLVAKTDSSVLILGESGTGKELVAHELHRRSNRSNKPFIKVNCAAVPRELYESEFFGHAKGAFTGALRDRTGRFELADGGTLFLDEIGEIPLELQAKLLRVLQEGELERVGEERTRKINVRLIAATNRDLRAEVEAGRFRQDLYYRLSVFPIDLPPLRKRLEDIPLLAQHFLSISATKLARPKLKLTLANVQQLQQYDWPGNVRELQHVIERAVITAEGNRMTINLQAGNTTSDRRKPSTTEAVRVLTDAELKQLEADNIRAALKETNGKVSGAGGAAELLRIKPTTLISRMRAIGIKQ